MGTGARSDSGATHNCREAAVTITTSVALPDVHPFAGMDVWSAFATRAGRCGDQPFLVWEPGPVADQKRWTYTEFADDVERVAAGLAMRGVGQGDAVMLLLENSPAFLLCWFACARLGAVAVDTNTLYSADELAHALSLTKPVGVVTHAEHQARLDGLLDGRWLVAVDEPGWTCSALLGDPAALPDREPDAGAPLCIQFTSGTTSRPKAVVYTHANALWGARVGATHGDIRADDVFLIYMPLFHTAALMWHLLPTFWAGGTVVVMPKYSASRFWDVSLRNGCTQTMLLGIGMTTLAEQPVPEHQYRIWQFALEHPVVEQRYGVRVLGCWGMTEVVTNVIVGVLDQPDPPLAIGRPSPEYRLRIVDEGGEDVPAGGEGELLVGGVMGLSLFAEYLDDPVATSEAFDDGWFRTGDCVRQLPGGAIQYVTRLKDMLKVGGENVAAAEIERVCMSVRGVTAAAVVARRDRMLDEVPVAFVVAPGVDPETIAYEVLSTCKANLARFKIPRDVHVIDELPERLLGKIAKADLREQAAKLHADADAGS